MNQEDILNGVIVGIILIVLSALLGFAKLNFSNRKQKNSIRRFIRDRREVIFEEKDASRRSICFAKFLVDIIDVIEKNSDHLSHKELGMLKISLPLDKNGKPYKPNLEEHFDLNVIETTFKQFSQVKWL